jgi:hypothetical protein
MAMMQGKQAEPPSWLRPPVFMIGQDRRGNWVVQDQKGVRGGLFVDRAAALRFVRFENGDRPQAVVMVSDGLELDLSHKSDAAPHRQAGIDSQRQRRIA